MALTSRVTRAVEIIVALTDKISAPARRIARNFRQIGDSAEESLREVDRSVENTVGGIGRFSAVLGRVARAFTLFSAAASAAFGVITLKTKEYAKQLREFGRSSRQLGTTVEELSRLEFAASQTGIQFNTLTRGLRQFRRRISQAAIGAGEAQEAFKELGISAEEINKLTLEEQLKAVADAFAGVTNESDQLRLAWRLFEGEGTEILSILELQGVGIEKLADDLKDLNGELKTVSAEGAREFSNSLDRLIKRVRGLAVPVGDFFIDLGNQIFRGLGVAEESVESLEEKIRELQKVRDDFESGSFAGFFITQGAYDDAIRKLDEYQQKLEEVRQLESDQQYNRDIQRANREANQALKSLSDERVEIEKQTQKELEKIRRQEIAAQQAAAREYIKNREEFNKLVQEAVAPATVQDVNILDITDQLARANQALAAGDSQAALDASKAASDLLIELRDQGLESGLVLQGLAQRIREIGLEASKAVGEQAIKIDFQANTDPVQQAIQELQGTPVVIPVLLDFQGSLNDVIYEETVKRGDNG